MVASASKNDGQRICSRNTGTVTLRDRACAEIDELRDSPHDVDTLKGSS